ncbi:MAG: TPM domain-containing protein, partial [Clostridia bacterium]
MLLLILATSALAIPAPTREFYASDDAGVMSSATRDYIVSHGKAIAKDNGAQVVVATVKSLEGQDIRDYGHELARSWGIGSGEKDNGVLILFALDERKIALEVGRSLEGALNDGKVGRLIDECAVPDFKNDNFDAGIMKLYQGTV